jgi:transposase InsO family protein
MNARIQASSSNSILKARSHRFGWAPHHGTISRRRESSPWHRLGVRPRLHRRHLASRLRSSQGQPAQESAVAFLEAAVAYFAKLGIRVERVMTDKGSCYRSKTFRAASKRLGLRQIFTRPYTPKTNGKAERFIQTALREWARAYQNLDQRSAKLLKPAPPLQLASATW